MMIKLILVSFLLLFPQANYNSDLPEVAKKFVESWNKCVENYNAGVLDLKSCKQANKNWEKVYNHKDWPK